MRSIDDSFGRHRVTADERKSRIRRVFAAVAPRYDLMNDLMSFGIHRLWKRTLAQRCRAARGSVVDLAGGTGDVARLLRGEGRRVLVCDPSLEMMSQGRRHGDGTLEWVAGEAEALPFPDGSIDLLTISFGLRNATRLDAALAEIRRVLKPGGRFVCLEFSRPYGWFAPLYDLYSYLVIPRLGAAVARAPAAYEYLVESIRRFPDQRGFAAMVESAGFDNVRWENLSLGIACLHFGETSACAAPPQAIVATPPRGWHVWWTAARPRTLTIATTPVLLGTAIAWAEGAAQAWPPALAALFCALLIQAGTNLHNDAADYERGNDTPERIGPLRVTAAGWASPHAVRRAAFAAFAAAFALGIYLVTVGGWPILALGLAALAAGWAYSGGPAPISHTPLGELFVWVFFGVAAVMGSYWLQADRLSLSAFLGGAAVGSLAAAVLMLNNYRDLAGDLRAGRRTLAALLGPAGARRACMVFVLAPYAVPVWFAWQGKPWALLTLCALPLCASLAQRIARSEPGPALNLLLAGTARAEFVFGLLLAIGISL